MENDVMVESNNHGNRNHLGSYMALSSIHPITRKQASRQERAHESKRMTESVLGSFGTSTHQHHRQECAMHPHKKEINDAERSPTVLFTS